MEVYYIFAVNSCRTLKKKIIQFRETEGVSFLPTTMRYSKNKATSPSNCYCEICIRVD